MSPLRKHSAIKANLNPTRKDLHYVKPLNMYFFKMVKKEKLKTA